MEGGGREIRGGRKPSALGCCQIFFAYTRGPLRNYLLTRAQYWIVHGFDEFGVEQTGGPAYAIGSDVKDLESEIQIQNDLFKNSLPANWTMTAEYPNPAYKLYFVIDKDAQLVTYKAFAATFVSDAVANAPKTYFPMLVNPAKTPRRTGWTDPAGIKRKPTPSDKGIKPTLSEAGIFDPLFVEFPVDQFVKDLETLAAKLRKAGDSRGAAIVKFAEGELVALRFSIVEVLDYLSTNGIL
jgi:hypothetical protein